MKVSIRTAYRLIEHEGLPYIKLTNTRRGAIRFKREWLCDWMEQRKR